MSERAGFYRTNLTGELTYKSFVPHPLPPEIKIDEEMISLLTKAESDISALKIVSGRIPDKFLFTAIYVRKEALLTSQIEGTQATLEDIFDPLIKQNANRDIEEVVNYIKAADYALQTLQTSLPLCNRLIRGAHKILMAGTRGQNKTPGEFRTTQNWIGGYGATIKTAKYIPPNPQDMLTAMSELEKYINADDETNLLIRAALIHYQFETIHPFVDGNGRVGRLLIMLFLIDKKVLTTPTLYISYFLKKYQSEYYNRLSEARCKGHFEQWIKFFLRALGESARDAVETIDELCSLNSENELLIKSRKLGRAQKNTLRVFEYLKAHPIIDVGQTAAALQISFNTVSAAVKRLIELEILVSAKNATRNRIFIYDTYLKILRRDT